MTIQLKSKVNWLVVLILIMFFTNVAMGKILNDHDIYTVNTKTGKVQQITSIPNASEYNPTWSNNGKLIAHDVTGTNGHSIYITDVKTGISTVLDGAEGGNDANWSSDGKKIAFDLSLKDVHEVHVISSKGGISKLVVNDALDPYWSHNSKRLVFHRPSDGSIRTVMEDGSSETFVTFGMHPSWSPNGKYIAFSYEDDIMIIEVNNIGAPKGDPVQITTHPAFDQQPDWSMNSETIVFHSGRDGDSDIWTIPSAGGTATRLTGLPGQGDYDPAYSKNGRYVAYAAFTPNSPAQLKPPTEVGLKNLTDVSNIKHFRNHPNPFNPSTTIVFELEKSGHTTMEIYNVSGELITTLVKDIKSQGLHKVQWNGKDANGISVPAGIYVSKINSGNNVSSLKFLLLK